MRKRIHVSAALFVVLLAPQLLAAKEKAMILIWPPSGAPVVRFTFTKWTQLGSYNGQKNLAVDVLAENLWGKPLPTANFSVYLFDKNQTRIAEGYISLANLHAAESVKFQMTVNSQGTPVSMSLVPRTLPSALASYLEPHSIGLTVNSVPQGAALKLDGKDMGNTPKKVDLAPGKHLFQFAMEGFANGSYPFEVRPDDVSGGSITVELGGLTHDTIAMRDGSVITGDVEEMDATQLIVRTGGEMQHINRNSVKSILLVQRESPAAPK